MKSDLHTELTRASLLLAVSDTSCCAQASYRGQILPLTSKYLRVVVCSPDCTVTRPMHRQRAQLRVQAKEPDPCSLDETPARQPV
jgi:hypothetical protein